MNKINDNTYIYNDSQFDTVYVEITDNSINFNLAFNAGSASIFEYVVDEYLSDYDNLTCSLDEYEKKNINGVER